MGGADRLGQMTRRRFHAPPTAFTQTTVTLTADEARHLRDVLRLKPGDEVYVFDGRGRECDGCLREGGWWGMESSTSH